MRFGYCIEGKARGPWCHSVCFRTRNDTKIWIDFICIKRFLEHDLNFGSPIL